jgi:hypothetical protein
MIPQRILDALGPDDRVAVLTRGGELRFLVHPAAVDRAPRRTTTGRDGNEVVPTHVRDGDMILALGFPHRVTRVRRTAGRRG